jgi:hypothetical protein
MAYIGRTKTPAPLTSADIPDGIVTAADLAPDSVGTSEIADSVTLVTPNLGTPSAVTLTNATFPAGHVIQVVGNQTAFSTSEFACTNTTLKDSDGSGLTISGVTAGNLLKINIAGGYHRMYGASSATGGCNWKIVASPNTGADTLVSGTRLYMRDMTSDYHHVGISLVGMYIVPSGVTSVEFLRELTPSTINASWNNTAETPMSCSIMEIQQ